MYKYSIKFSFSSSLSVIFYLLELGTFIYQSFKLFDFKILTGIIRLNLDNFFLLLPGCL